MNVSPKKMCVESRMTFITLAYGPFFVYRMVFVGEVNIGQCPTQYADSVQHIISYCNSQPKLLRMPWIVNTMGFNKGQNSTADSSDLFCLQNILNFMFLVNRRLGID